MIIVDPLLSGLSARQVLETSLAANIRGDGMENPGQIHADMSAAVLLTCMPSDDDLAEARTSPSGLDSSMMMNVSQVLESPWYASSKPRVPSPGFPASTNNT